MAYQDTVSAETGLVAYWKLDETSGTSIVDSKNGYNATSSGGWTVNQTSLLTSGVGKSASLATNGRAILTTSGDEANFDFERTQSWTIEAIIQPNITRSGADADYTIWSKVDSSSPFRGYELTLQWINASSRANIRVFLISSFGTKHRIWTANSVDLQNGANYHVVASYDSGTGATTIWINGQRAVITTTSAGTMDATCLNNIVPTIGSRQAVKYFAGKIDEVAVYNVTFTSAKVQEHYLLAKDYTPLADPVSPPVLIIDTDMAQDVDDVGDLAVAHRLADASECTIAAVIVSAQLTYSAPCVYALNDYYGRASIPIGAHKGTLSGASSSVYAQTIRDEFGISGDVRTNYDDALDVYRQALHDAADGSVTIVLVGLFQCIVDLLNSAADGIDSRSGVDLIADKVDRIVVCAGVMPGSSYKSSGEFNIRNGPRAAAIEFFAEWPSSVPIQVVGIEMGDYIATQPPTDSDPGTFPVKRAYDLWDTSGSPPDLPRPAWGQLAILYAVRGFDSVFGVGGMNGTMTITDDATADNQWSDTAGNVDYAVLIESESHFASLIDGFLEPTTGPPTNSVAPAVTGTEATGKTLSCTAGTWSGADSYAYQWCSNSVASTSGGTAISGATSSTYVVADSLDGLYVYCVVTATNEEGSDSEPSNVTGQILGLTVVVKANPTFADVADFQDQTLINEAVGDAGAGEEMPAPSTWETDSPVGDIDWSAFTLAVDAATINRSNRAGATLISPNYVVLAAHAPGDNTGHTWMTPAGAEVTRTLGETLDVDYWEFSGSDLAVAKLSAPINNITPMPMILDSSKVAGRGCLVLEMDRHLNAYVIPEDLDNTDASVNVYQDPGTDYIESGDSGKPVTIIIDDTAVMVMTAMFASSIDGSRYIGLGPNASHFIDEIFAITAEDGESPTVWDLQLSSGGRASSNATSLASAFSSANFPYYF